jgi:CubicO group peptidase (beta-lactamase class C family)
MSALSRVATIVAAFIGIACGRPAVTGGALDDAAIREMVRERVESGKNAAIVVGILEADGKRRTIGYGVRAPGGDSVDARTVFEIGSITKVFTATMLAEMVRRGDVALDDPIAKYLPADVRVPSRKGRQITLLDLSTQHSGLPRMPTNFQPADSRNPYADYTATKLHEFLSSYTLERDIGERFEYSNVGVGLLGYVLARRAGASYEAALVDRVLAPLKLDETRITLSPGMRARLATGHGPGGQVAKNWDIGVLEGAGGLRSTPDDMLTFAAAHFDHSGALHTDVEMTLRARRSLGQGGADSIGLNWLLMRPGGHRVAWHNGGTGGYRSFLGLDLERRRAVVVLTNTATSVDDLGMMILTATQQQKSSRQ